MTENAPGYRRLDCGARALAYLRVRPQKGLLRIDVTGLWVLPRSSPIGVPNAAGAVTLLVGTDEQKREAMTLLLEIVSSSLGPVPTLARAA